MIALIDSMGDEKFRQPSRIRGRPNILHINKIPPRSHAPAWELIRTYKAEQTALPQFYPA